jgi:hypothetical protein
VAVRPLQRRPDLTEANGTAERTTALDMIEDNAKSGSTVGGDKNYYPSTFDAGF